jgi:uncharacterized protein DUF4232
MLSIPPASGSATSGSGTSGSATSGSAASGFAASGVAAGRARGRRAAWLTVAAAAAAGLLAGCASAPSSPGSSPATGKSTQPAQGQGGTAPASPAGTGAAVPGLGSLALCQASALKVTVNATQTGVAVGSSYYPVDFTNTASAPCGLYGYPGVSFVTSGDGAAHQIGAAAQQNPGFGKVAVRLAAGGVAHAWLQVSQAGNYPSKTCQPVTAHWLRVYAPGQTQALYVNQSFSACSSDGVQLLTVMPVRSGQGVQGSTP